MKGLNAGYEIRGHFPAIKGVRHHIIDGTPALRFPSKRPRVRRTTQSSPCCLARHYKVWRPNVSATEHNSEYRESQFPSLSSQRGRNPHYHLGPPGPNTGLLDESVECLCWCVKSMKELKLSELFHFRIYILYCVFVKPN